MRWFKTDKSYPTLNNFPHIDMSSVREETTILEEDYSERNSKKRGRDNDVNESNYETPKPSKKTIIHPGGHFEIIDMANNKTSTPKKKTDEEEIDDNVGRNEN